MYCLMKREIDEHKMFLTTLRLEEEAKEVQVPKAIQEVHEEFKDIMLVELPKRLPPRRESVVQLS